MNRRMRSRARVWMSGGGFVKRLGMEGKLLKVRSARWEMGVRSERMGGGM